MRLPFITSLANGKITVLLFHKVPKARHRLSPNELEVSGFEQVLDAVMENFRIVPLSEAVTALSRGNLPARSACITFDDGYPEWVQYAAPVLEKRNAHATFFVTSGQFEGLPMWNERILHAVDALAPDTIPIDLAEFGLPILPVNSMQERQTAVQKLDLAIKYLAPERKEAALQKLEGLCGLCQSDVPRMTADELRLLHSRGFTIGAHSITHPILTQCSASQAYAEIAGSREMLEGIVGAPVRLFAYPNGVPRADFTAEHVDMVRKAGYFSAFSTHKGVGAKGTSLLQIPRFTPWGPSSTRMAIQLARNLLQKPFIQEGQRITKNKTLMVAFHFPPQAGSSGTHRTLNFVKHMARAGMQPTVLTANYRAYESVSEDLLSSVPPEVKVIRAFGLDASRHLSIRGKYPGLIALPDRWASWGPAAVLNGWRHIRRNQPDVIWSTYPIATAHCVGGILQRLTQIPWIADFRDPMVTEHFPKGRLQRKVWSFIEEFAVRNAVKCVFTTQRTRDLYSRRYPEKAEKFVVIENGYDEEVFIENTPLRADVEAGQILILHSGVIYPIERDPEPFFFAFKEFIDEKGLSRKKFKIRFRAPRHEKELILAANRAGLEDLVEVCPAIPYREAIAEIMGADMLLLFQGSNFDAQIPAKLYEYVRAGRPILALTGENGDTKKTLDAYPCSVIAPIDDVKAITRGIEQAMGMLSLRELQQTVPTPDWVHQFSRAHGAAVLMSLVRDLGVNAVQESE